MTEQTDDRVVYTAKALPTQSQVQAAESQQMTASLGSRGSFGGWWPLLKQYGMIKTKTSRFIGEQGIPGNCSDTLLGQMDGLEWKIVTRDGGEQNDVTDFFQTVILEGARDSDGNHIGATGLFNLIGQDMLNAKQGGNFEITRIESKELVNGVSFFGVPTAVFYVDADTLAWKPKPGSDEPIVQVYPGTEKPVKNVAGQEVRFRSDQIAHGVWSRYSRRGSQWYNRHPIQMAWMAISALAASDDYNYSILTDVIPQGLLDLGENVTLDQAKQWKAAWDAARQGKKLEDIGLLWGGKNPKFLKFNDPIKDAPFQHMSYWYLTITTGAHGMSPLDIGFMTQLNTKAGAEVSAELSKNKGLARLLNAVKRMVEFWILPPDLIMAWEDLDPADEKVEAETRKLNTDSINGAVEKGWMSLACAQTEALRLGAFEDCGEVQQDQETGAVADDGDEEDQVDDEDDSPEDDDVVAATVQSIQESAALAIQALEKDAQVAAASLVKAHKPEVVQMWCPLCKAIREIHRFEDHGGLCVCQECECTFDPSIER